MVSNRLRLTCDTDGASSRTRIGRLSLVQKMVGLKFDRKLIERKIKIQNET
jgi:hypothetical protein